MSLYLTAIKHMTLKLGKLSKTKIKEACFECLKENGFTVTDVEIGNGYFIFEYRKSDFIFRPRFFKPFYAVILL